MKIDDCKKLYHNLGDELSQILFLDRLLYSVTEEYKYIYRLIEDSMPELDDVIKNLDDNREIIVYGAGINCDTALYFLRKHGKKIAYICDRNTALQGTVYQGILIISVEELLMKHQDANILISTTRYLDEVRNFLIEHFSKEQIISLANEKVMKKIKMQYFDDCISLNDGEIFVDGGCYDFETSKILMTQCKPQIVYAFEPEAANYSSIKETIKSYSQCEVQLINRGLWDKSDVLHFVANKDCSQIAACGDEIVEVVALDEVISGNVTFIKMDIEGAEMNALKGAQQIIKKYKPKLAICIYHKQEDVIDILEYIKAMVPEYKLYIRHHSINFSETVVYAVVP